MLDYNGHVRDSKIRRTSIGDVSMSAQSINSNNPQPQFVSSVQFLGETVSAVNSVHRKGRVDASKLSQ